MQRKNGICRGHGEADCCTDNESCVRNRSSKKDLQLRDAINATGNLTLKQKVPETNAMLLKCVIFEV